MTGIHRDLASIAGRTGLRRHNGRWGSVFGTDEVREGWRARSSATGWTRPRDWYVPEVDGLVRELCAAHDQPAGPGPLPACAHLGRARAEAGVGLTEALDDLCALFAELPAGSPPIPAVRAFVEAWVDVWLSDVAGAGCVDPLTELSSVGYLRARLAEIYRAADRAGTRVADTHLLVVVSLDADRLPAGGWRLLVQRLTAAESLRAVFGGGETLAALTPTRTVALVARDATLRTAFAELREGLAERASTSRATVRCAALPDRATDVPDLLADLVRSGR